MDISLKAFLLSTGIVLLAAAVAYVIGGDVGAILDGFLVYFAARCLIKEWSA